MTQSPIYTDAEDIIIFPGAYTPVAYPPPPPPPMGYGPYANLPPPPPLMGYAPPPPPGMYAPPPPPPPSEYAPSPPSEYAPSTRAYARPQSPTTREYAPPSSLPPRPAPHPHYAPPTGLPPNHYESPHAAPPVPLAGRYSPPNVAPPGKYNGYNAPASPPPMQYEAPSGPPPAAAQNYGPEGQLSFTYSQCTGARKALLIGINYYGSNNKLSGCINDVHNIQRLLVERFAYDPGDMVILTEDQADPVRRPTRANILRAMQWLVGGAKRDDSLFFHYSGHGTIAEGEGVNGHSEAICPVDFQSAGLIISDDMHNIMVSPLPAGCRLTAVFDSCHSGSAIDLPYAYSTKGTVKEPNLLSTAAPDLMNAGMSMMMGNDVRALFTVFRGAEKAWHAHSALANARSTKTAPGDVIAWGGCKDSQTSADTQAAGQATGAMSYAFVRAVTSYPGASYQQLLVALRAEMQRGGYSQKPQLSACHPIDTSLQFVM